MKKRCILEGRIVRSVLSTAANLEHRLRRMNHFSDSQRIARLLPEWLLFDTMFKQEQDQASYKGSSTSTIYEQYSLRSAINGQARKLARSQCVFVIAENSPTSSHTCHVPVYTLRSRSNTPQKLAESISDVKRSSITAGV